MHVEVKRYKGHQYHYSGYTVCFMQNIIKLYDTLLKIPEELNMIMLRPLNIKVKGRIQRQFT